MNVFLCGQKEFGAAVFRRLLRDGVTISGACCPLKNSRGQTDRLRDAANTYRVPTLEAGTLQSDRLPSGIDLIVCAHSHDFVGAATRRKAVYGAVGFHPSLLPRHRGRDAIRWTLKMRDAITGGSVYWLDDRMDAGPIASQEYLFVDPDETVESLWREKLFPMGVEMISRVVREVAEGRIVKEYQNELHATFEPACNPPPVRRPDLLRIDWKHPVELMGP